MAIPTDKPTASPGRPDLPNRKRMRLWGFNYSMSKAYFVTIVTQGRVNRFGAVINGQMVLNDAGRMVETCYKELGNGHDDIECLDYVIMPNHLHFIVHLHPANDSSADSLAGTSLYELVKRLKSKTTVGYSHGVKQQGWAPFDHHLWQRGYYDHIIRHERAYDYIRNYIYLNPERWFYDKINPECSDKPDDINKAIKDLYA